MTIVSITPKGKSAVWIETEEQERFALSRRSLRLYGFKEGTELSEEQRKVLWEELRKKAIAKCGDLLKTQDYTRAKLAIKLRQAGIPKDLVEYSVKEMEKAHYLDDMRFTEYYIKYHLHNKSRMRIQMDLRNRGVSEEDIERGFQQLEEQDENIEEHELAQIQALLVKKHYDPEAPYEEKAKIMAFLYRRGFRGEMIQRAMRES